MFCSSCQSYKLKLIDSHRSHQTLSDEIQRRTYKCTCGFSKSVYVIPKEILEEYKELKLRHQQAIQVLTGLTQTLKNCSSCSFWDHDGVKCDLGLPEAGGTFAEECSSYLSSNDGHH